MMTRVFLIALMMVCGVSTLALADNKIQDSLAGQEQVIAGLFDTWNKALATGKPEAVVALYADDGILLPTVSNKVRTNHAEIQDYFEHFLQLKPQGVINEQHIKILDDNTAINDGIYTFTVTKEGKEQKVQARYTYVYEKDDAGVWKIQVHHSSKMPE
jgi:uncharacterized protein (TIGR02246 family)